MNIKNSSLKKYFLLLIFSVYFSTVFTVNSQLILYATSLNIPYTFASTLTANFNSLIFVFPLLGGYWGDHFNKNLLINLGLICCLIGLYFMSLNDAKWLYIGVSSFVLGNGLLMPNLIYQINYMHDPSVPKSTDGHMVIFYLFMNLGAFLGASISGVITEKLGYSWTFRTAYFCTGFSLLLYWIYNYYLSDLTRFYDKEISISKLIVIILKIFALFFLTLLLLKNAKLSYLILSAGTIGTIVYLIFLAQSKNLLHKKNHIIAFLILCLLSVPFWMLYMLEPSLISLFTAHFVQRTIMGIEIPATSFFSLNPCFIIIFGFSLNYLWQKLNKANKTLSAPIKFSLGILLVGTAYLLLACSNTPNSSTLLISPFYLIIYYGLLALAELLIGPTGLAMAIKLAPIGYEGRLLSFWQLFIGLSATFSGSIVLIRNDSSNKEFYIQRFFVIGLCALTATFLIFLLRKYVNGLINLPSENEKKPSLNQ